MQYCEDPCLDYVLFFNDSYKTSSIQILAQMPAKDWVVDIFLWLLRLMSCGGHLELDWL